MTFTTQRQAFFESIDMDPDGVEIIVDPRLNIVQITKGSNVIQMTLYEATKMAEFIKQE